MKERAVIFCCIIINSCFPLDFTEDLEDGYIYFSEAKADNIITNHRGVEIPRAILDYKYDNEFITAMQTPIEPKEMLDEENKQLENPEQLNYWIIEKKGNTLHGPLVQNEFLKQCNTLKISKSLRNLSMYK